MKKTNVTQAIREAKAFIEAAETLLSKQSGADLPGIDDIPGSRESGAVRRQSMNLSNALADMRQR